MNGKMKLVAARANKGLTQKEASKLIGVSNKTYGYWETGKSFPSVKYIPKICEVFGLTYDDIDFLPVVSLKANGEVNADADSR